MGKRNWKSAQINTQGGKSVKADRWKRFVEQVRLACGPGEHVSGEALMIGEIGKSIISKSYKLKSIISQPTNKKLSF